MPRTTAVVVLLFFVGFAAPLSADEVWLKDGSKVHGEVQSLADEKLSLLTTFAGLIHVDAAQVIGITTESRLNFALSNGVTGTGKPVYEPDAGQSITETAYGEMALGDVKLIALWLESAQGPAVITGDAEPSPAQAATAEEVAKVAQEPSKLQSPWTARLELGVNGTTGNNERLAMHGRAEANRNTSGERFNVFLEGRYAKDNGVRSQNEIIGGAKLEVDLTEKTYAFGKVIFEHDEFENLDLRSTATVGLGRFLIKEETHELKARAGVGYQHESFMDGTSQDEAILELGYDYRLDVNEYLRFTHSLTYYPTFANPITDYRLVAETGGEIPVGGNGTAWKLKAGMKNQYDANPQPGVERLDTWYFLSLVYDLK